MVAILSWLQCVKIKGVINIFMEFRPNVVIGQETPYEALTHLPLDKKAIPFADVILKCIEWKVLHFEFHWS